MRQRSLESREIICVDKLDARKPLDFNLFRISPEVLIDQNNFTIPFINCCIIFYNMILIAVRQEVKSLDNSVVVHELELAIKRNL